MINLASKYESLTSRIGISQFQTTLTIILIIKKKNVTYKLVYIFEVTATNIFFINM